MQKIAAAADADIDLKKHQPLQSDSSLMVGLGVRVNKE